NQGAASVTLSEMVPANTTFNAGASTAGWNCAPNTNAGSTCTFPVGSLVAGASGNATFAVTVVNPVAAGVTQISNTATIADDGANGADPTPANNSGSDTTPITAAPVLTLGKSDGGVSVAPGGTVAYVLTVTNTGNQVASGVRITETVPLHTIFNPGASTAGWACAPNGNAGSTCTLLLNNVATTANATFAVTVDSPVAAGVTQISNTASVADDGSNGPQTSASASDTTPLNITLDLSITKSVTPTLAKAGDQIVYTIRFTSTGNTIAEGVRITDTLPAEVTISVAEYGGVPLSSTVIAPPTLAWLADPMAPGATGIITLTGTVNANVTTEQDVTNTVVIAHQQETAPANNTATATFTVNLPPTAVAGGPYNVNEGSTVVLSGASSSDPGNDTLSYAWDLDNNGSYETAGITATFGNTADDGVFTVGLRVTDTEGATATATATVNVLNVAPSVNAGPDQTTTPNKTVTFAGSFTDPGILDTHTIAWDFGDGQGTTGTLSPTHAFSLPGTYTVTLTITDDDNGVGVDTMKVVVANHHVYLPHIVRATPAADLVVQNVTNTGTSISVVIKNQGDAPVTDAFWVDLYLNPAPPPTAVNQIWQALAPYGMVWGVTASALPLQPGQSLTLTTRDQYFRGDLSSFPASIPTGTRIYVQVDSAAAGVAHGAVLEGHEAAGQPYNNIVGPRVTTQPINIPPAREDAARPDAALPARPDAANR
ncbi:MAG TPA: PKD domain-containing protein, partial [Herpetosiphonaceae bacterium]|nr:PKD domain-containing protein [Herpetosiphonaceae bacterium]